MGRNRPFSHLAMWSLCCCLFLLYWGAWIFRRGGSCSCKTTRALFSSRASWLVWLGWIMLLATFSGGHRLFLNFLLTLLLLLYVIWYYLFKNLVFVLIVIAVHQIHQLQPLVDVTFQHFDTNFSRFRCNRHFFWELDWCSLNPLYQLLFVVMKEWQVSKKHTIKHDSNSPHIHRRWRLNRFAHNTNQ